ncbi:MAG: alpha/beta hydrolase [Acidobacteriota bacterium]|nr:alpha/beta hydrolase [Acidobacteriota bacterium]
MTTNTSSQIRSIEDLRGPAGRLEALLNVGHDDAPFSALVCHPHPAGGGTLHNKVVYNAMKVFSALGLPVLRFNFRGVGLSEGTHDDGRGEQDDVRAALDWLDREVQRAVLVCGFSFGASVALNACCDDPRVSGLIGLGLPVHAAGRNYSYRFLDACITPKLFLSGDHDQFAPAWQIEQMLAPVAEPKRVVLIEGAEHFFQGTPASPGPKLDRMQAEMRRWLAERFDLT